MNKIKLNIFFAILLFSYNKIESRDINPRVSLGAGIYNFLEHGSIPYNKASAGFNLEFFTGRKYLGFLKPFIGVLGSTENSYYGYFGLSSDLYFSNCKCFILTPSLAVGSYSDGDDIRMGHTIQFRSGGDITYKFRNNVRIGLGIFHISNAGLGYRNPGSEQIILKYQIPINR